MTVKSSASPHSPAGCQSSGFASVFASCPSDSTARVHGCHGPEVSSGLAVRAARLLPSHGREAPLALHARRPSRALATFRDGLLRHGHRHGPRVKPEKSEMRLFAAARRWQAGATMKRSLRLPRLGAGDSDVSDRLVPRPGTAVTPVIPSRRPATRPKAGTVRLHSQHELL